MCVEDLKKTEADEAKASEESHNLNTIASALPANHEPTTPPKDNVNESSTNVTSSATVLQPAKLPIKLEQTNKDVARKFSIHDVSPSIDPNQEEDKKQIETKDIELNIKENVPKDKKELDFSCVLDEEGEERVHTIRDSSAIMICGLSVKDAGGKCKDTIVANTTVNNKKM